MTSDYAKAITAHYLKFWPELVASTRLKAGPMHELPNEFSVLTLRVNDLVDAYATRCMSTPDDTAALEIHLFTRADTNDAADVVELLTTVAHFHRTGARLSMGHTVNFGRPWLPNSDCSRGLLSLPYLYGPDLEWLDSPRVRFLWLIPITDREFEYKRLHGLDALEQAFEAGQLDHLNPYRTSLV